MKVAFTVFGVEVTLLDTTYEEPIDLDENDQLLPIIITCLSPSQQAVSHDSAIV